jgi:hypothetical protein
MSPVIRSGCWEAHAHDLRVRVDTSFCQDRQREAPPDHFQSLAALD